MINNEIRYIDAHIHTKKTEHKRELPAIYLVNCIDRASVDTVADIKNNYIIKHLGIHPYEEIDPDDDIFDKIELLIKNNNDIHIGEIGLDNTDRSPDIDKQIPVFEKFISFAVNYNRVANIHCVRAFDKMFCMFKSKNIDSLKGIIHRFEGSIEIARELIKRGLYLSFHPFIHNNEKNLHIIRNIPIERVFLETDADEIGQNTLLIEHYAKTASALQVNEDDLIKQTYLNYLRLYYGI